MSNFFTPNPSQEENEWMSVSDLMAGLMVIFLFIAVVYLRPLVIAKDQAIKDKEELTSIQASLIESRENALNDKRELVIVQDAVKQIVWTWKKSELDIFEALQSEFGDDLSRWNAELDKETLTIRFKAPEVLFGSNEAKLKNEFKSILMDFIPRYLEVLYHFKGTIEEIRIEGHTSTEWGANFSRSQAYFNNMALSQQRTRAVLEYAIMLKAVAPYRDWAYSQVTANGLSSSQAIRNPDGLENLEASRRVEFRVRTNAKDQIIKVIETIQ